MIKAVAVFFLYRHAFYHHLLSQVGKVPVTKTKHNKKRGVIL